MPDNNTPVPLIDQINLQQEFGGYNQPSFPGASPNIAFQNLQNPTPQLESWGGGPDNPISAVAALENSIYSLISK